MEYYLYRLSKYDLVYGIIDFILIGYLVLSANYERGVELEVEKITNIYIYVVYFMIFINLILIPYGTFMDRHDDILRYKFKEKVKLYMLIYLFLIFIGFILTTSFKLSYLLYQLLNITLFCSHIFGKFIHFIYYPSTNISQSLPKVIVYYTVISIIGYTIGNYLYILDWYQIYAQFPISHYISISFGHLVSSFVMFLYLKLSNDSAKGD